MQDWEPVSYDGNVQKFLDFLGKAEGADYNTIVGGKTFDDFSAHPNVVGLRTKDGPSTASGKYQITKSTYDDVAPKLGITDFSKGSQDRIAVELIKRNGALEDVQSGNFDAAINKLGGTWASLPSSQYNQPKRSKEWVDQQLAYADNGGWEPATTASDAGRSGGWTPAADGWEPVSKPTDENVGKPVTDAKPAKKLDQQQLDAIYRQQKGLPPAQQPTKQAAPQDTFLGVSKKDIGHFIHGVGDTASFGFMDELAGKGADLLGYNGKDVTDFLRKDAKEGGKAMLAGQVAGAFIPGTGTIGAVRAVPTAGRLARAAAGAATGIIQGGLYGAGSADDGNRLQGAATGATVGAATGGVLGGILPATVAQKGSDFIKKAGSEEGARLDAEIIRDLQTAADNPNLKGNTLKPFQVNALEQKYVSDANNAVKSLGKDGLEKLGVNKTDLQAAIQSRRILTPDELSKIRGNPAGDALADAIEKAQRARALTEQVSANPSMLAKLTRMSIDAVPTVIGATVGGVPGAVIGGMATPLADKFAQRLTGKASREEVVQQLIKNPDIAENVLSRLGPSQATQSLDNLQQMAQRAQAAKQAQIVQQQAAAAQKAADAVTERNAALKAVKATTGQGMPEGGAFQTLLRGGESNLNLGVKQAVETLRSIVKNSPDEKLAQAAKDILQSKDTPNLYRVQNTIRILQEQGRTGKGALTEAIKQNKGNIPDATYKQASDIVSTLDDGALSQLLNRTKSGSGKDLYDPRGYATSKLAKMMHDANEGRALSEEAQGILSQFAK